jgi:murein DD-endopeptidase MepM/ murein hydrolase activator NlpD
MQMPCGSLHAEALASQA